MVTYINRLVWQPVTWRAAGEFIFVQSKLSKLLSLAHPWAPPVLRLNRWGIDHLNGKLIIWNTAASMFKGWLLKERHMKKKKEKEKKNPHLWIVLWGCPFGGVKYLDVSDALVELSTLTYLMTKNTSGINTKVKGRHVDTTSVGVSLWWPGLRLIRLLAGSWHGLPVW